MEARGFSLYPFRSTPGITDRFSGELAKAFLADHFTGAHLDFLLWIG